jgi:PAS domain S-box-containing protein
MKYSHNNVGRPAALRIVAIYALFAALWIYLSDHALGSLAGDAAFLVRISVLKGFLFIIVTGVLLYQLIARYMRKSRKIEEELRVSQDLINALLEGTTDAIYVKDRQGRYLLFNSAAANFTGKDVTDVINNDDTMLFPPEEAGILMAADQKVMDAGQVMTYEEHLTVSDGTHRIFLATKGPVFDATGEVSGLFGIARDITDRKQAEDAIRASERRFHSLFENMLEGFAYCRMMFENDRPRDFVYLDVNGAFERLTGLKNIIGKKVSEVIPGIQVSNPELFEIYGRVALNGKPEKFETYVEPLDDWFSVSVYSPEKECFVAVFDVITERKRAEEAQETTVELLRLCNKAGSSRELMRDLTRYFQQLTGCEAVGVRLRKGDDFPYYETRGFPEEFVLLENSLCAVDQKGDLIRDRAGHPALECMCGNIICGRFDPSKTFFTAHGSFWSSCTTELLASTTDADRQAKTRNRCNGEGYESVALIPLRLHGETFGLVQFNDKRRGRFTAEKIALLEVLVDYVAIALAKLKTDEALQESNQFNQQIINSAEEGVIVYGSDLRYQVWNPFMERLSGLAASEVLGKHPLEVFPFLRGTGVIEQVEKALDGQTSPPIDFPYHSPESGRSGWTTDTSAPLRNMNGDIIGVIGTVREITERKRAVEALHETAQRLQLATASGGLGIWDWDVQTNALAWDDRMFELYGISKKAFSQHIEAWQSALHPDDAGKTIAACQAAVRGEREYDTEFRVVHPNGVIRFIKAHGVVVRDKDGRALRMIGINRDITEQRNLEEKFRQAQKMEAIGHLAGGVAHDFNNILTAIIGYGNLLNMKLPEADPLHNYVDQILVSSEKAANLTHSLLAFSRKQVINPIPVDINEIVAGMKKILDRIIGEDIEFKVKTADHALIVKSDKGQMEQVLMNLVTNARDAMPHGGMLTITTEEAEIDERFVQIHQYGNAGRYAVVSVMDTGVGMDNTTQDRIFEPFFTTKEVGKGTGLGLAMVYGTIKQHDGFINVYSESGTGSAFRIYLPLAEYHKQLSGKKASTAIVSGNETLLLVEDDTAVRKVIKTLLEELGYHVIEAIDGEHAVNLFQENRERIQLVVSDMIMPKLSGKDVYKELKKIKPDIKILFISGYTADILKQKGIENEKINFISKPLRTDALSRKIREVLDKQNA